MKFANINRKFVFIGLLVVLSAGSAFAGSFVYNFGLGYSALKFGNAKPGYESTYPNGVKSFLPLGMSMRGGIGYEFGEVRTLEDGRIREPQFILGIESQSTVNSSFKNKEELFHFGSQIRMYLSWRPARPLSFSVYGGYSGDYFRSKLEGSDEIRKAWVLGPVVGTRMSFLITRVQYKSLFTRNDVVVDEADWGFYAEFNALFSHIYDVRYEFGAGITTMR